MGDNNISAFTVHNSCLVNQLTNEVTIEANGKGVNVFAIWDTGAVGSCISRSVATDLNLVACGYGKILTPSGEAFKPYYSVDVRLPNNVKIERLAVCESEIGNQETSIRENGNVITKPIGMLIGMDIIGMGDFAVSNFGGKTEFTFRCPPFAELDFVQMLKNMFPIKNKDKTKPNDPCPCGSGKKYKNCHGKRT